MVDDHHRVIGHTQSLGPEFRSFSESLGDNRYRRPAPFFRFYSVVETPRCAGASISHCMDDSVAFSGQAVQYVGGSGYALAGLPVCHHFSHAILFLKHPA